MIKGQQETPLTSVAVGQMFCKVATIFPGNHNVIVHPFGEELGQMGVCRRDRDILRKSSYTLLVCKDRVHGTIKVGSTSPLSSAFCCHCTRVSRTTHSLFYVQSLLCSLLTRLLCMDSMLHTSPIWYRYDTVYCRPVLYIYIYITNKANFFQSCISCIR